MNRSLLCKECGDIIDLFLAIDKAPYSWVHMSSFWYKCLICNTGNHIKVIKDRAEIYEVLGAPGPNIQTLQSSYVKGLDVRQDSECLHVWYNGLHRVIPIRK